jgi:hypothetical protein
MQTVESQEVRLDSSADFFESSNRYKIVYISAEAKSKCVGQDGNIVFIITNLYWSGRRDSNPRPSAPEADSWKDAG